MAKDLAIILNNGSLNSAVATALAAQKFRLAMLFVEASALAAPRTRGAYEQQVAHFKPYREHSISMQYLAGLGGADVAAPSAADPRVHVPITPKLIDLIPLLAAASRYAVHYSATAIYCGIRIGTHADELAQGTEFVQVWQEMLQMTCNQPDLEVVAPLMDLEPWQVVDLGYNVSTPFDRTWSCIEENPEPCWACRQCRARDAAFQQAAKPDPLKVPRTTTAVR